jgi:hypothetical protein
VISLKKEDEDFIESLWCKLRDTQDDRLRALRDGNKHKSTLLAGEVNGMLCVIKKVEDYFGD